MHTGMTLTGDAALDVAFRELPERIQRKHLRRGVRRAGTAISRAAKVAAPIESGLLKKSIGQRVFTHRDKLGVGTRIGPRKGWRRAVYLNKKGALKAYSKRKQAEAVAAGAKLEYRDPARYGHLVELGLNGQPFMTPAFEGNKGAALGHVAESLREGLVKEAPAFLKGT